MSDTLSAKHQVLDQLPWTHSTDWCRRTSVEPLGISASLVMGVSFFLVVWSRYYQPRGRHVDDAFLCFIIVACECEDQKSRSCSQVPERESSRMVINWADESYDLRSQWWSCCLDPVQVFPLRFALWPWVEKGVVMKAVHSWKCALTSTLWFSVSLSGRLNRNGPLGQETVCNPNVCLRRCGVFNMVGLQWHHWMMQPWLVNLFSR